MLSYCCFWVNLVTDGALTFDVALRMNVNMRNELVANFALGFRAVRLHVLLKIIFREAFVTADLAIEWTKIQVDFFHVVDEKNFLEK